MGKYHKNYISMDTVDSLLDTLTKQETKQLLLEFVDAKFVKEFKTLDEWQGAISMVVGLGDVVGIQIDRSKKPTKFKIHRRKGTGVGKISMF